MVSLGMGMTFRKFYGFMGILARNFSKFMGIFLRNFSRYGWYLYDLNGTTPGVFSHMVVHFVLLPSNFASRLIAHIVLFHK